MSESAMCVNGHQNPTGNQHCGTCGVALDAHEAEPASGPSPPPARSSNWALRNLVIVGVAAIVFAIGLWAFNRDDDSLSEPSSEQAVDRVARECDIDPADLNAEFEGYWDAGMSSYTDTPDDTDQSVYFVYSTDPDQLGKAVVRLPGLVDSCPEEAVIAGG